MFNIFIGRVDLSREKKITLLFRENNCVSSYLCLWNGRLGMIFPVDIWNKPQDRCKKIIYLNNFHYVA